METASFNFDDFARGHLLQWHDGGGSPNNWTVETLLDFALWVNDNQSEFRWNASWPELAAQWEGRD